MSTIKRIARRVTPALSFLCISLLAACGGGGGGGGDFPTPPPSPQVAGTLAVGEGHAVDSDTNDPHDPAVENNTPADAQVVSVPTTIGGYANSQNDEWDVYRVRLPAAATILLAIADPVAGDLDLYLAGSDGAILDSSTGTGLLEIIQSDAAEGGEFLVAVHAFDGASNYLLSIGMSPATDATVSSLLQDQEFLDPSADFVVGEVVATFRDNADGVLPQGLAPATALPYGLVQKAALPGGFRLLGIEQEAGQVSGQTLEDHPESPLHYRSEEEKAKARTLHIIKKLRRRADVVSAEPNYLSHGFAVPNDEFFGTQWHYRMINLPQAWDITTGSDEVIVAVIDSGVLHTHPDLAGRMLRAAGGNIIGFDFISDPRMSRDGDGIDSEPFDNGDLRNGHSSSFHGTHVAGTIAAATNNEIGVAGATWQGKIMPLRVLGVGGGTDVDIAQAILYAVGAPNASGTVPPVRAKILNLSLGTVNPDCRPLPPLSQVMGNALGTALNAGAIVVVAAGNDGCHVPTPMSTLPGVISVSALDRNGRPTYYSNSGPTITVSAPGGDTRVDLDGDGLPDGVMSTMGDDSGGRLRFNYEVYPGTSMAAPHVAGVIALMLSVNPALTTEDIHSLLAGTHPHPGAGAITRDLGAPGRDDLFGHGLIDAFMAVQQARAIADGGGGGTPPPAGKPVLAVAPESLNFGTVATSLQLIISNPSTAQLEVTAITADAPWIAVNTTEFPTLTVMVNRTILPAGTALGAITIQSNGGSRSVPVSVRGQEDLMGGDVGTIYVLILDPESLDTVAQGITSVRQAYAFQIPDLPSGEYFIAAGSDRDDNGLICESGEACGIYPLLNNPVRVRLDGPVTEIDFPISFSFSIMSEAAMSSPFRHLPGFERLNAEGEQ